MNSYDQFQMLRDNINEASAAHWTDVELMRKLNQAQRKIAIKVAMSQGQWLVKSVVVNFVNSVITLPADCSKPIYLEENNNGAPVNWLPTIAYRRVSRDVGTTLDTTGSREAYPLQLTLEVNRDGYNEACTLWYQIRVPDLVQGTAPAGAATSLTLPDDRITRRIIDYYNNVSFEVISGTGTAGLDQITDYTAARVCTVTGTYDATTVFGTISMLPEEAHYLMVLEATVSALHKPSAEIDKETRNNYISETREIRRDVHGWLESRIIEHPYVVIGDDY